MSVPTGWKYLPRSIRHRLSRRRPFWFHEHIISPYADRLRDRAMGGHYCQVFRVEIPTREGQ